MLHIGEINRLFLDAQLIHKAGNATGDYHGQMNVTNFEKWVVENLFLTFHLSQ
jgi:hypothetical protein